jgi:hypothetical protein
MDITRYFKKQRLEISENEGFKTVSSGNATSPESCNKRAVENDIDAAFKDQELPVLSVMNNTPLSSKNIKETQPQQSLLITDACNSAEFDIGRYINTELNDYTREKLLLNCWIPPDSFIFPTKNFGKRNLMF